LRTRNRPPKGFKGKSLEAINFNRNDSVGIAIDLINFEKLGVKFNRLLNRKVLEEYIYLEKSRRVYLMLEPPNLPTLEEKIKANIQIRRNNVTFKKR